MGLPLPPPSRLLLVVDSLGALLGPGLGGGAGPRFMGGHAVMAEVGRTLARLSRRHGLTVLLTNSLVFDRREGGGAVERGDSERSGAGPSAGAGAGVGAARGAAGSSLGERSASCYDAGEPLTGGGGTHKPALGPSWRYIPDISVVLEGGESSAEQARGASLIKHSECAFPARLAG